MKRFSVAVYDHVTGELIHRMIEDVNAKAALKEVADGNPRLETLLDTYEDIDEISENAPDFDCSVSVIEV